MQKWNKLKAPILQSTLQTNLYLPCLQNRFNPSCCGFQTFNYLSVWYALLACTEALLINLKFNLGLFLCFFEGDEMCLPWLKIVWLDQGRVKIYWNWGILFSNTLSFIINSCKILKNWATSTCSETWKVCRTIS